MSAQVCHALFKTTNLLGVKLGLCEVHREDPVAASGHLRTENLQLRSDSGLGSTCRFSEALTPPAFSHPPGVYLAIGQKRRPEDCTARCCAKVLLCPSLVSQAARQPLLKEAHPAGAPPGSSNLPFPASSHDSHDLGTLNSLSAIPL